jgi:predicted kinase
VDVILFIGIPASGKSTFYKERFFTSHIRLNLDMLHTRRKLSLLFRACLDAKQSCVIDNTNLKAKERATYIEAARNARFQTIGYFFTPNARRAQAWNNERQGAARVPDVALWSAMKTLEVPTRTEGFDALYTVILDDQGQFIVTEVME